MSQGARQDVRVLYLEDAFDQALLVKTFFSAMPGFAVTHVQDGDQALELIRSQQWDLLVTDLNLPGTDGFAVIREMRKVSETIPILVTTGYTQAEYEEQALRAGANQVMIKPLTGDDFQQRVHGMVTPAEPELFGASPAPPEAPPPDETAEPSATPAVEHTALDADDVVLAIAGRLGDVEMGCGGSLMKAIARGRRVVIVPVLEAEDADTHPELKAASLAAEILGVELRVDRTLFGDADAQRDLVERTLNELRPATVLIPAPDDRDPARKAATDMAKELTVEVPTVYGYETATTGLAFVPSKFIDVRQQMVSKMEALAAYQSLGAPRVDLRPRMAQAYARYWGRFMDFSEVEAFELIRGG